MSVRSNLILMAGMMAMMGPNPSSYGGMSRTPDKYRSRRPVKYTCPPLTVDELAPGNKLEKVQYIIPRHEPGRHYLITVNAEYGYGTNKSKLQKYRTLEAQIREFVMKAPISILERTRGMIVTCIDSHTGVLLIEE